MVHLAQDLPSDSRYFGNCNTAICKVMFSYPPSSLRSDIKLHYLNITFTLQNEVFKFSFQYSVTVIQDTLIACMNTCNEYIHVLMSSSNWSRTDSYVHIFASIQPSGREFHRLIVHSEIICSVISVPPSFIFISFPFTLALWCVWNGNVRSIFSVVLVLNMSFPVLCYLSLFQDKLW